jgi:hypothetical protein
MEETSLFVLLFGTLLALGVVASIAWMILLLCVLVGVLWQLLVLVDDSWSITLPRVVVSAVISLAVVVMVGMVRGLLRWLVQSATAQTK